MLPAIRKIIQEYSRWRWRHSIIDALALHRRGEARSDGLTLVSVGENVKICWRARAAHPWDLHPDGSVQPSVFTAQVLHDTEAALLRLFEALPGAESIELSVLDQDSDRLIVEGRVSRSDFQETISSADQSVRMRLKRLGLREYVSNPAEGKYLSI